MCDFSSSKVIASFHFICVTFIWKLICLKVTSLEGIWFIFFGYRWRQINHWDTDVIGNMNCLVIAAIEELLSIVDIWRWWNINHRYYDITFTRLWNIYCRNRHLINWWNRNCLIHAFLRFWTLLVSIPVLCYNYWDVSFTLSRTSLFGISWNLCRQFLFLLLRRLDTWLWFVVNTLRRCLLITGIAYYFKFANKCLFNFSRLPHWSQTMSCTKHSINTFCGRNKTIIFFIFALNTDDFIFSTLLFRAFMFTASSFLFQFSSLLYQTQFMCSNGCSVSRT